MFFFVQIKRFLMSHGSKRRFERLLASWCLLASHCRALLTVKMTPIVKLSCILLNMN